MLPANNFGIWSNAGYMIDTKCQVAKKDHASRSFQGIVPTQFLSHQNGIDLRASLEQGDHRHKDPAMRRHVKISRLQQLDSLSDQRVVENYCAQNSAFGIGTAGKRALENRVANRFRRSHWIRTKR